MKKFGKFVFTTVSLAAAVGAGIYFVKNVLNKDSDDDFDDFDDDFDDFDLEDDENDEAVTDTSREYVTINRAETPSETTTEEVEEDTTASEE